MRLYVLVEPVPVVLTHVLCGNHLPVEGQTHHLAAVHDAEAKRVAHVEVGAVDGPRRVHAGQARPAHHDVLDVSPGQVATATQGSKQFNNALNTCSLVSNIGHLLGFLHL